MLKLRDRCFVVRIYILSVPINVNTKFFLSDLYKNVCAEKYKYKVQTRDATLNNTNFFFQNSVDKRPSVKITGFGLNCSKIMITKANATIIRTRNDWKEKNTIKAADQSAFTSPILN